MDKSDQNGMDYRQSGCFSILRMK